MPQKDVFIFIQDLKIAGAEILQDTQKNTFSFQRHGEDPGVLVGARGETGEARMDGSEKRNHSHPAKRDEFISLNIADVFNCCGDYFEPECDGCRCYSSMKR